MMNEIPYLMRPANSLDEGGSVVQEYQDVGQRMNIHKDTVDQRVNLRQQYKNQVFRPGHNMPTKTLEELAEEEYHDAMMRQQQDEEAERMAAMEDPESEEVLERERLKKMQMEDWADYVPKGRGITKRI